MLFQNKIRRGILTRTFLFLVRGSDIDQEFVNQEFYPNVSAEQTPEQVRFTFIAMKIFFSTHILTDGFNFI